MPKLQRIMLDGGFSCPNRQPKQENSGGCSYCRNDSFAPDYWHSSSSNVTPRLCRKVRTITEQLEAGKRFFAKKYKEMEYVAYFQSYSCTYAPVDVLRRRYDEALAVEGVKGLVIGTRPDCLQDEVLDLLEEYNCRTQLTLEIGVESCHDHVLQRINRGHTFAQAEDAIRRTAARGIRVGVHMILGLPEETTEEMIIGAEKLSLLPIDFIKLHQLQILKDTRMADDYTRHPEDFVTFPTAEDYVALVKKFRKHLRSDIRIERYVSSAPSNLIIAPRWGLKPFEIKELIEL